MLFFIESIAAFLALFGAFFLSRLKRWAFIPMFFSAILYVGVMFSHHLVFNALNNLFFAFMALVGFVRWGFPKRRIIRLCFFHNLLASFVIIVLALIATYITTNRTPDAPFPFLDSLTTILGVFAYILLSFRVLDTWFYWIIQRALLAILFLILGMYPTLILVTIFLAFEIYGWYIWYRVWQLEVTPS